MTRLRKSLSNDFVTRINKILIENTLKILKENNCEIILLTADTSLPNDITDHCQKIIIDNGNSLNNALIKAYAKLKLNKCLIIMPDLPNLNGNSIKKIISLTSYLDYFIIPSSDNGTCISFLPFSIIKHKPFGLNSSSKISQLCLQENLNLFKLIIPNLNHDLDTYEDYTFWKKKIDELLSLSEYQT